jgi:hypothetical protein
MKYLRTYKIFESVDLVELESTVDDISLEIKDLGYEVMIYMLRNFVSVEVISKRSENLYSKWTQDRENFSKKEYNKCSEVLDRLEDFLKSEGMLIYSKNLIRVSQVNYSNYSQFEHGVCDQGYDSTGTWEYNVMYHLPPPKPLYPRKIK